VRILLKIQLKFTIKGYIFSGHSVFCILVMSYIERKSITEKKVWGFKKINPPEIFSKRLFFQNESKYLTQYDLYLIEIFFLLFSCFFSCFFQNESKYLTQCDLYWIEIFFLLHVVQLPIKRQSRSTIEAIFTGYPQTFVFSKWIQIFNSIWSIFNLTLAIV